MNQKQITIGVVILVILAGGIIWYSRTSSTMKEVKVDMSVPTNSTESLGATLDVKNAKYTIESREVILVDGVVSSSAAPGSASVIRTSVLEGPAYADIDADNKKDAVVILRDEPGGTGIFYYVAVLLTNGGEERSTNALLLGDRIRIKEIYITPGVISVKILNRAEGEVMSTAPMVEKLLKFRVNSGVLEAITE